MCRPPAMSAASDGRLLVCHTRHPRSRPSIALHVCFLTDAPRRCRPGRCPAFYVPVPPTTSTDCPAAYDGGRRWFPGDSLSHRLEADGHCAFPVMVPRTFPPAVLGAPPPATLIICRRRWGPVIGQQRRRVRPVVSPSLRAPAGDPTLITQVKVRTRVKSRVLIETREMRLSSRECDFLGINIPTGYLAWSYTCPKTVIHPSPNWAWNKVHRYAQWNCHTGSQVLDVAK